MHASTIVVNFYVDPDYLDVLTCRFWFRNSSGVELEILHFFTRWCWRRWLMVHTKCISEDLWLQSFNVLWIQSHQDSLAKSLKELNSKERLYYVLNTVLGPVSGRLLKQREYWDGVGNSFLQSLLQKNLWHAEWLSLLGQSGMFRGEDNTHYSFFIR